MRECVLGSGLDPHTPGLDVQRACGTSLEAAILLGNKIALGQIEAGIAGGVDSISDPPIVYPTGLPAAAARKLSRPHALAAHAPWLALRPGHLKPMLPGVIEPRTGLSMGQSCELMVKTWKISREDQDELAFREPPPCGRGLDARASLTISSSSTAA